MTKQEKIVKKALEYIQTGDIQPMIKIFTPDATIEGTLYKTKNAEEFFNAFFKDTLNSTLQLKSLTFSEPNIITVNAEYTWTLKDSQQIAYTVVGHFHFNKKDKIEKLSLKRTIQSLS